MTSVVELLTPVTDEVAPSAPGQHAIRLIGPSGLGVAASLCIIAAAYGPHPLAVAAMGPGALAILLLPGFFLLGILRSPAPEPTGAIVKAVGLSIPLLVFAGLFLNTVLPLAGVDHPLARPAVVAVTVSMLLALGIGSDIRSGATGSRWPWPAIHFSWASVRPTTVLATLLLPAAVLGPTILNANGSPMVSIATELLIALIAFWTIFSARRRSDAAFSWILYCQSASLLLLTSLRGTFLTGHDILYEFSIFQTTLQHSHWSMNYLHDPYNACLSITILPVMLSRLLAALPDQYIFRVIFQLIFALTPVAAFTIARKYADSADVPLHRRSVSMAQRFSGGRRAYAAGFVSLASAALIRDFPYITRQEIALFLFGALVVALGQAPLHTLGRRVILTLLAGGLVVSHYSTAYATVAILAAALFARAVLARRRVKLDASVRTAERPPSSVQEGGDTGPQYGLYVTLPFTGLLAAAVIIWQAGLTRTTGDLGAFAKAATQSIGGSGSLIAGAKTYPQLLHSFIVHRTHNPSPPGGLYPPTSYRGYVPDLQVAEVLPSRLPPMPTQILVKFGEGCRLLLQILMVAGCFVFVARSRRKTGLVDFTALACGALALIAAAYVLPAVGQFYSPLRVFQQVLIVLGTTFMVAVFALALRLPRALQALAVAGLVLIGFLSSSPISAQYLSSPEASLQLDNFGLYYDIYDVHGSDISAIAWLDAHLKASDVVYADRFASRKIATFSSRPLTIIPDVLPYDISRNGYVFVDVDNATRFAAYDFEDGREISYRFPSAFVVANKRLVFSDGDVRIYR